jgi:hypothetical protein
LKGCAAATQPGLGYLQCLGADEFIKDIFLDSDTDLIVLSFVPSTRKGEPLTIEEAAATASIVEKMQGTHRIYLHGRVNPNQEGDSTRWTGSPKAIASPHGRRTRSGDPTARAFSSTMSRA